MRNHDSILSPPLCPICRTPFESTTRLGEAISQISCKICGEYSLEARGLEQLYELAENLEARTKISHFLANRKPAEDSPLLQDNTVDSILKTSLPNPKEQADKLTRWVADRTDIYGTEIRLSHVECGAFIGSQTHENFAFIVSYLIRQGILNQTLNDISRFWYVVLSMEGWAYYDSLLGGDTNYRRAFMAMQFNNEALQAVVTSHFKPATLEAGFELSLLTDEQPAGLIDDQIRARIQSCDFVIADLSDNNPGAYWEAGYAEGLGKPVIYTCEQSKFDKDSTHFDTNHHLTVPWDKDKPEVAANKLTATIRATLPDRAIHEVYRQS
ncbi:MAG: nucleoside 2-deoxyribosyltransferase [Pseudomonadota bacterium]